MTDRKTEEKIHQFFSRNKISSYKKGEIVLRPDDQLSHVYYIVSGFVRMFSVFDDGKELTVNIFKAGSYFPMFLIIGSLSNTYYYQAMTPVRVQKAPKEETLRLIKNEPDVLFEFTSRIVVGINGLLTNIQYLLFGTAHRRVASVLTLLARRFGEKAADGTVLIQLPLSHQDIADLIGMTRETTSLEMEILLKDNLITYNHKRITVRSIERLEKEVYFDETAQVSSYSV